MEIRDATPDDYPIITAIRRAIFPDEPAAVEDLCERDANRDPRCLHRAWIADYDGQGVGFVRYDQFRWTYHPQHFFVDGGVIPQCQGRGMGAVLYDTVLAALARFDPLQLVTAVREDQFSAVRWLEKRDLTRQERTQWSALDLTEFDPAPWTGLPAKLQAEGIAIRSLAELQACDPDWARKLYDLDTLIWRDVPGSGNFTPQPFDQWSRDSFESSHFIPEALVVAVHDDLIIGVTNLVSSHGSDALYTDLTGVRREYRRKKIATALKVRTLMWAKASGYPCVRTSNDENNPMLQLNYMLGFEDTPAWLTYRKIISRAD